VSQQIPQNSSQGANFIHDVRNIAQFVKSNAQNLRTKSHAISG